MAHEIHKIRVRAKLPPRKEPYWGPNVGDDVCVGFRKANPDTGYWIARWRRSNPLPGQRRYEEDPLGLVTDANDYEAARAAAINWRNNKDAGITDEGYTCGMACREYVEDRRREKGEDTAHDAQKRFERTVYGKQIEHRLVSKLRAPDLKAWRDGLGLSKSSAYRTLTAFKAALNLAVQNDHAPAVLREVCRKVKGQAGTGQRRDVFLDRAQRKALLERTQGALRDLIEGAALTGARAGELTKATRRQFDARTGSMTFFSSKGHDGPRARTVPLSPGALGLFERLSSSKLPAANLFIRDDGRPWAHSDWDELVAEAAQLARLPPSVCLYTFRHSFITEMLMGGMPTLEVARMVGTSVAMIEKHYGHLVAKSARERLAAVQIL